MNKLDKLVHELEPNQSVISKKIYSSTENNLKQSNETQSLYKMCMKGEGFIYKVECNNNKVPELYYNRIKWKENTFIYSILRIMDSTFDFMTNKRKTDIINAVKQKMCYDLIEKKYYFKFGYARKRKFKKEKLQKYLLDLKTNIDEEKYFSVRKYIIDYFNINLITISNEGVINTIYTEQENVGLFKYRPTIMMFIDNNKYHPILKDSIIVDELFFKYEVDSDIIDNLYKNCENEIIYYKSTDDEPDEKVIEKENTIKMDEPFKKVDEKCKEDTPNHDEPVENVDEVEVIVVETPSYNKKNLTKMKMDELQKIVIEMDKDIEKTSDKTGKKIKKKKAELIDTILE